MRIIARAQGRHGEIYVVERITSGDRLYVERGVQQSCVRSGGDPALVYVRLMRSLLAKGSRVLLLGCGGGALATALHRDGLQVTVVDSDPLSFKLTRKYFWMPPEITCVTCDMAAYLSLSRETYDAIGVDVGGAGFDYRKAFNACVCSRLCEHVEDGGRIAVNVSCHWHDTVPETVGGFLERDGLDVWVYDEKAEVKHNVVLTASTVSESRTELATLTPPQWTLRRPWDGWL